MNGQRVCRRPASRVATFLTMVAMFGLAGCGEPEGGEQSGPQATIALISPQAPLGLAYGEQATLLLRYHQKTQPAAGVILTLHIDGENTGATLSADRIVTNDHGEASVLFTAGAAEAAFHVVASAPLAQDLVIDVAVSKYAFGNLDVFVDATEVPGSVTHVRAALVAGTSCADLPPSPVLGQVLRLQQAAERQATLPFPTLLVRSYSVIGRAEDANKRLLAYGCVELPDQLLRTGLRPVVPVPLELVFPSPLGRYAMTLKLNLLSMTVTPPGPAPLPVWQQLGCSVGLGQVLINAILQAIPMADESLAMRISALRAAVDMNGCRVGMGKPDDRLHTLLDGSTAGATLQTVAQDGAALQKSFVLQSTLEVYAATDRTLLGAHTLDKLTLNTPTRMGTYNLAALPTPSVRELSLSQSGAALMVPEHGLTLRLPALWRRALDELVLMPRGITMTPQQLFQAAVTAAGGCSAVETLLCMGVTPPCTGKLLGPCMTATSAAASSLTSALADAAPGLDFFVSQTLTLDDPNGTLEAQTLEAGQVSGQLRIAPETLSVSGTATGEREP